MATSSYDKQDKQSFFTSMDQNFFNRPTDLPSTISAEPVIIQQSAQPRKSHDSESLISKYVALKSVTPTTVFISDISPLSNDNMIRQLIQYVGKVVNWRRVQGANNKLESFGFIEYPDQEDALRAIRLLNGLIVCDKALSLKVDEKTRETLDKYEQDMRDFIKIRLKPGDPDELEQINSFRMIPDQTARTKIQDILDGHVVYGARIPSDTCRKESNDKEKNNGKRGIPSSLKKPLSSRTGSNIKSVVGSMSKNRAHPHNRRKTRTPSDEESRDEYLEKRRLERRKKYKNECYVTRLKRWQNYEENISHELEKRFSRDSRKKKDRDDRVRRILDFLDNYDDDRDDQKYYHGSTWEAKLNERENELECDDRDRKREKHELDSKNMPEDTVSELPSDPEITLSALSVNLPHLVSDHSRGRLHKNRSTGTDLDPFSEENLVHDALNDLTHSIYLKDSSKPIGFGIKKTEPTAFINPVTGLEEIFVPDEEEVVVEPVAKKIKLTVIDEKTRKSAPKIEFGPESAKFLTPEERAKKIKRLISKIPTGKSEVFAYDIKWYVLDEKLVEKKIQPWLRKKIVEYIGEEEKTLVKYLCLKIVEKAKPEKILSDISMILDEESETFVVKLWRLLIYETEAKSEGLTQE